VASPIKIGEYLGCGLPLILTKGIGDFSELIPRTGIGLLLDETSDPAMQICAFMEKLDVVKIRDQAINFSNDHFSNEAHLQEYENLYG
jgi:glycosyltransferase involved in cell wall biosynthesis